MEQIELHGVLPQVFAERTEEASQVWRTHLLLKRGESVLIEAASGKGKSSLCSFVYGYRSDYEGHILFDGEDIRRFTPARWAAQRRTSLSILFQELRLFPELTALENIRLKNTLTGYASDAQLARWMEAVGIADRRDAPAARMSLGQQQRVAFIRALCQPFDFILMDEPVSHLDEENARVMAEILTEELQARGSAAVVTSIGKPLPLSYHKRYAL